MKKQPTKRYQRSMRAGGEASNEITRPPRCFPSQIHAAEFIRERALKRILWDVRPKFKPNYMEMLCSKKSCDTKFCDSRGVLVDAQNIVNKAFSEENVDMKIRLARAALKFDNRCVDAHIILGLFDNNRFITREQHFCAAVNAGLQLMNQYSIAHGPSAKTRDDYLEPRAKPYARALSTYSDYRKENERDATIIIWNKLLQLDSGEIRRMLTVL